MYAVIETGGKQYRVQNGDIIVIEKLNVEAGKKVTFDKVLMLGDGKDLKIGKPYLDETVEGKVIENGKGKKVVIFKYKAKKDYRKKQGHRQPYTKVEITAVGGSTSKPKAEVKSEAKPEVKKETKTVSMSMKKDELLAFAEEHGIKVDAKATKQVIVDTIKENLK